VSPISLGVVVGHGAIAKEHTPPKCPPAPQPKKKNTKKKKRRRRRGMGSLMWRVIAKVFKFLRISLMRNRVAWIPYEGLEGAELVTYFYTSLSILAHIRHGRITVSLVASSSSIN
jgi:hypothetical protein